LVARLPSVDSGVQKIGDSASATTKEKRQKRVEEVSRKVEKMRDRETIEAGWDDPRDSDGMGEIHS